MRRAENSAIGGRFRSPAHATVRLKSAPSKPAPVTSGGGTVADELAADEAYAFLNVVAPKLEQLRRRLVVANNHLKSGDPEQARLNAIMESQTAIREFLVSIPHLSALAEPIDVLLEAVREDPAPQTPEAVEDDPEPEADAGPDPAPQDELQPASPSMAAPVADAGQPPPSDTWLQIGTALMVERLTTAGMPQAAAESHVESAYGLIGLSQANGSPISLNTIRTWCSGFISVRQGGWRGNAALKRKVTGRRGVNPVVEAQQRVSDMAAVFKKMAQLGAIQGKSR
jgi:hypothetical protein